MSKATPTAPPWRQAPSALALCAWRDCDTAAIGEALTGLLAAWMMDWELPEPATLHVRCGAATDAAETRQSSWGHLGGTAGAAAWLGWQDGALPGIAHSWFGAGAGESPIVAAVVNACRDDLVLRITGALRLASGPGALAPGASDWTRWSGTLLARLPGCGLLLMQAGLVRALSGSIEASRPGTGRHGLASLRDALRNVPMQLQAELDGCDIDIGALQALQVGDVLALRHRIDAPAFLAQPGGGVMLGGWLARDRDRKALELASRAGAPEFKEPQ